MADLARIKNNVAKMAAQGAPEQDIDGYIASEGVTVDDVRNFRAGHSNVPEFRPVGVEGYDPKTGEVTKQIGKGESFGLGAADSTTFGFGDEIASYPGSWISGKPRDKVLAEMRRLQSEAQSQNPGSYLSGQIGGGVAQAIGTGGAGFGTNAIRSGAGLTRVAAGTAADGAIYGALQGAGGGTDASSRALGAGLGGVAGMGVGFAAPYAVAGVQAAARPFVAPIMSRVRPQPYAERAMAEGLRRAGYTTDQIADALRRARADGQEMFNVADAMGHSGQRMLSTVARNPNEMRQPVVDTLTQRQMGQGERLSNTLAEGFASPDTAAQRAAALTTQRGAAADVAYDAARRGAGPVDVSRVVAAADNILTPGITRVTGSSNIADDSLEGVVRRARSLLTDGQSNLTDFSSVLRAKQDIQDMIGAAQRMGRNNQVRLLSQINSRLDEALESASAGYRAANDTFRQQSRTIDAVDVGRGAASGRTRAADNIQTFGGLTPEGQQAFRAGYADPMIARVESSAIAPTTNKARPLMTEKTGREFPAFAAPGRGDQMGRRIAREQRMFETANTALGGSKTADNLADAAEMGKFDPGVIMSLVQGRPIKAAVDSVARLLRESQGMTPGVIDRVARMLLETRPDVARAMLAQAARRGAVADGRRALANAIIRNMGGVGGKQLTPPRTGYSVPRQINSPTN
jgi:hypothetical protein